MSFFFFTIPHLKLSIPDHFANIAQLIQLYNFPNQLTTTNTNINLPIRFNQSKCATSPVYRINQNAPPRQCTASVKMCHFSSVPHQSKRANPCAK